jgi:7-carboxy-7-deazaguanine synthase
MKDLGPFDVLKFVVGNREDLEQSLKFKDYVCYKYLSPVFGQIEPKEIVEFMKENNLQDYRLQVQLHKIVYPPEMRGV